ncbi:MAG: hypothetical protein AB7I19_18640 [Planctomycetota bacterium]
MCTLAACRSAPRTLNGEEAIQRIRQAKAARELLTLDPSFVERAKVHGAEFPDDLEHGPVRRGDTLLFGIESFDDDTVTRYLLRFRAVDVERGIRAVEVSRFGDGSDERTTRKVSSRHATIEVDFLDEAGKVIARDVSEVPIELLELGLFAFTTSDSEVARLPTLLAGFRATEVQRLALDKRWGVGLFDVLFRLLRGNAATRKFAMLSSTWPGLFELPSLIGASITMSVGFGRAKSIPQPIECERLGSAARRFAADLYSGSGPLMEVTFVVVPPIGPLGMSAGVVTASGHRPTEPTRHFVVRLIGIEQAAGRPDDGR